MALTFDPSTDEHLEIPNITMNGWTTASVSCWAKVDALNKDNAIFIIGNFAGNQPLIWWRDDDSAIGPENNTISFLVTLNGNEERAVAPDGTWNDTDWHHIVGVFDSTPTTAADRAIYVYFDGELKKKTSGYALNATISNGGARPLSIGNGDNNPAGGSKRLDGAIEDFRVYQRALSQSEITTIYNSKGQDFILDDLKLRATFASGIIDTTPSNIYDLSQENQTINITGTPTYGDQFFISEKRRVKLVRPT